MEPKFVIASNPILPPGAGPEKSIRGSRSKSKDASKDVSGGTKTGKRGIGGSSKRPLKRRKVSQPDATKAAPAENVAKSDVKSEAQSDPTLVVLLQIILVCKTIIQRPKRGPVNYFTVLFIC